MIESDAILDAALDLFERQTFGATTVPAIADRAGVAVGSLYRHYPGKNAIANAVYQRWKRALGASLARGLGANGDREIFGHLWRGLTTFACDHPEAFGFLETHSHAPYLDDESMTVAASVDRAVESFVRAAQRRGTIRPGRPDHVVAFVFGAFIGLFAKTSSLSAAQRRSTLAAFEDAAWSAIAT